MTATKEQERKALAQIKKIVDSLGEDSYIVTAFEGCFEMAEDNIENDFANSWKYTAETNSRMAAEFESKAAKLKTELDELKKENEKLRKMVFTTGELEKIDYALTMRMAETTQELKEAAEQIVELADESNTEKFQTAVRKHRNTKDVLAVTKHLIVRVEEVKEVTANG